MTLWRVKHRKAAIFPRKMSGFEVFLGLREHEVRSNPCLMPICRATHIMMLRSKGILTPMMLRIADAKTKCKCT